MNRKSDITKKRPNLPEDSPAGNVAPLFVPDSRGETAAGLQLVHGDPDRAKESQHRAEREVAVFDRPVTHFLLYPATRIGIGAVVVAANEELPDDSGGDDFTEVVTSSGIAEAANESQGWVRLARYGDWPHPMGLQRFTRKSAEEMARRFNGSVSRAMRFLGRHRPPVYRGHPDDPVFANSQGHEDSTVHAGIEGMEAREDGLYVRPAWSNETDRSTLPQKFSPRWAMRKIAEGVFEPIKLISVGLTDSPNIPDFANQRRRQTAGARTNDDTMKDTLKKMMKRLGYNDTQIEAFANQSQGAPTETEVLAQFEAFANQEEGAATGGEVRAEIRRLREAGMNLEQIGSRITGSADSLSQILAGDMEPPEGLLAELKKITPPEGGGGSEEASNARIRRQREIDEARMAFANEREKRIDLVLSEALSNAKITEADKPTWKRRLKDASDIDAEIAELHKQTTSFSNSKKGPKTANLGERNGQQSDNMRKFRDAVDDRMREKNESWQVAWANCKRDPKLKELYEATGAEAAGV